MKRFLRLLVVGLIALFMHPAKDFRTGLLDQIAGAVTRYTTTVSELTHHVREGSLDPSMLYRILPQDIR
jgi:hypothetical protein